MNKDRHVEIRFSKTQGNVMPVCTLKKYTIMCLFF